MVHQNNLINIHDDKWLNLNISQRKQNKTKVLFYSNAKYEKKQKCKRTKKVRTFAL